MDQPVRTITQVESSNPRVGSRKRVAVIAGLAVLAVVAAVLLVVSQDSWAFPDAATGTWQADDITYQGEELELEVRLSVGQEVAQVEGACNDMRFERGGQTTSTTEECSPRDDGLDLMELDQEFMTAIRSGGHLRESGTRLTFNTDRLVLEYIRIDGSGD